ncbi:2OG-FeII-Oxy-2 domain containing protein [Pyrenophora tritici-repentis]|nr:2OG-FeII-Oxy-2 domain containing protein [Pyrenophora tritici-repentis]
MALSKRGHDDAAALEDAPVTKQPKLLQELEQTGMLDVPGNFGSLSSGRPKRERKPPERYSDVTPQPSPRKRTTTTPKTTAKRSSRKPATTTKRGSQISKGLKKNSKIQSPKVLLGSFSPAIVPNQEPEHESEESDLSPLPPSLLLSAMITAADKQTLPLDRSSECAQNVPAPLPASSQNFIPNTSQTEATKFQTLPSHPSTAQTPEDPLRQTPQQAHTDNQTSPVQHAYLTPGSEPYPDIQVAHENLDLKSNLELREQHTPPQGSYQIEPTQVSPSTPLATAYARSDATTECEDMECSSRHASFRVDDDLQHLRAIAEQLLGQRNVGQNKPEPIGKPEVWAEGRQELCETLHYFRSYQSSSYATGGFVRGFMFDKLAHDRDYIDSDVILSRAGGGRVKDKDSGEMKAGRDQKEDSVAAGLRNCMLSRNPVVIITGVDNPHIPSKPPHQYCVLDHFKPTHIWSEKSGGNEMVRYRFEKLNTKKDSWWRAKDGPDVATLGSLPPPVERQCGSCGVISPQVYLNGWMCLRSTCASFWKLITATPGPGNSTSLQEPNEASLIYDPRFLKQKTPWVNDDRDYPLVSNTAELSPHARPGDNTSVAFWSGIVCPKCGSCIPRINWTCWTCPNTTCDFVRSPPHTLIPALSLRDPFWPVTDLDTHSRDTYSPLIDLNVFLSHGYRINRFKLPGIDGFVTHMIANKTVLEEDGGPDAMFEELQLTDIGLERRSMPSGQLKGPNYCRQFLVNYGMPYKFIATTASRSFDGAARAITSTRSRLNWAAKLLFSQKTGKSMQEVAEDCKRQEFNEVLALGYFQGQKINYHDDGEYGLGPTIATLSLGAPGTMRIRMKARQYHGISSNTGLYDDAPPIPGCQKYEDRLALQPELDALKQLVDTKPYNSRRKQIPKELGLNIRGQAKEVLTMQLGHGDIVMMHGAEVQQYYEHAVEHEGSLRFALTCRYIDPKSLKEEDRPAYAVEADGERYDGSRLL